MPGDCARHVYKHLVILSEVAASQSEAATKSKDPKPACAAGSAKRNSQDGLDAADFFSSTTTTRVDMNPKKYWVYIMGSVTGTLYIGMTNNIDRRMAEHKSRAFEGFALKYQCDRLVYYESFDDVRKAIDREKQLKGWIRAKKIAYYIDQPQMAGLGGKVGSANGICGGTDKGLIRECLEAFLPS